MKLLNHLQDLNYSSRNATQIREQLIMRGLTPSIGQVRVALKTLVRAQETTETIAKNSIRCPICPDSDTHDTAYHNEVKNALDSLTATLTDLQFHCDCGNLTPHNTETCKQSFTSQEAGMKPNYHCAICEMYGDDCYADPNGIIWVNGITACELNRQIAERTRRQDSQMRQDLAASAFSTFRPNRSL